MEINYQLINLYFICYLSIYLLVHLPFDIGMIIKRGRANYPSPPFKNVLHAVLFIVPSILFWAYLLVMPVITSINQGDLYSFQPLKFVPLTIKLVIQIIGFLIMSLGLVIDSLGRIGRGFFLKYSKAKVSKSWGHAIVRHPSYLHYIVSFIALPLITFNPVLLFFEFGIYGYLKVTETEEKALIDYFGEEYLEYMSKVGKLFPKIRKNRKEIHSK
jgi:protein-S-isoprenylcysteine O-methyltransferase Ste14